MVGMIGQVLESHKITFYEDELPPEGLNHNRALHITVQFEDKFIARVLIDGSSSLNICPLDTLKRLGKGFHEIWARIMNVKAFDGSQRATIGEINLCLQMGPTWFDIEFQADTIWGTAEEEALAGMKNLFLEDEGMDCNEIIKEEEEEGLTIQTVEKGSVLRNWTATSSRAHRVPGVIITFPDEPMIVTCNEATQYKDSDSEEEDEIPEEETRISIHLSSTEKEEYIRFLKEYEDIFAWSYDDMTGLSTSIVAHKLPNNPMCLPMKQKLRTFKLDMSLKIKEELTKQIKANVRRVVEYPIWLANIVPVLKKDRKVIICVDY
ncbi:uncharacterized protein [Nicotiana sylvestris]|uniref:uncharacterized protein n=1 Tax=Nicotiana sylvestris TaxID=4096 RepID=UPI00388C9156